MLRDQRHAGILRGRSRDVTRATYDKKGAMRRAPIPLLLLALAAPACRLERQPAGGPFSDDFNRAALGDPWFSTSPAYRLVGGELVVDHAYNHPLWLKRPLPADAVIELDAWSNDPAGDLKVEAWGDGHSYAETTSYTATSYVFVFGGWHNQISVIARMNEHGNDRRSRVDRPVERGRHYHFRIARKGRHIDWQIDGAPFLEMNDPEPLRGPDHAFFAFNDWEAELHFDNLRITANE
jgi:hypothetical protein